MTERLKVYAYNVLFGDAILVELPGPQFIMIDAGNAWTGHGGDNEPLLAALEDVRRRTKGHIDLYVMTHEHMDHVQGLRLADDEGRPPFVIEHVWLTASADPNYYTEPGHEEARKKKLAFESAFAEFDKYAQRLDLSDQLSVVRGINNLAGTAKCVEFLRTCAKRPAHYLHREASVAGTHKLHGVRLRILAPEEDTSAYYGRISLPMAASADSGRAAPGRGAASARSVPLPGIDGSAFYDLVDRMDHEYSEAAFQIDKANNNTSLVVELKWRGRRLLFTGDAEEKSWAFMATNRELRPVDLLKISHHGSHNGTPPERILNQVLPRDRKGDAVAVVSTRDDVYPGVPSTAALDAIKERVKRVYRTDEKEPGKPVRLTLTPAT